jgi:hypothetical protein
MRRELSRSSRRTFASSARPDDRAADAQAIAGAELRVIKDAGAFVSLERPSAANQFGNAGGVISASIRSPGDCRQRSPSWSRLIQSPPVATSPSTSERCTHSRSQIEPGATRRHDGSRRTMVPPTLHRFDCSPPRIVCHLRAPSYRRLRAEIGSLPSLYQSRSRPGHPREATMSIKRMLILSGLLGLTACSTPTGLNESLTNAPDSTSVIGHSTPLGSGCGSSQRCAPLR